MAGLTRKRLAGVSSRRWRARRMRLERADEARLGVIASLARRSLCGRMQERRTWEEMRAGEYGRFHGLSSRLVAVRRVSLLCKYPASGVRAR